MNSKVLSRRKDPLSPLPVDPSPPFDGPAYGLRLPIGQLCHLIVSSSLLVATNLHSRAVCLSVCLPALRTSSVWNHG